MVTQPELHLTNEFMKSSGTKHIKRALSKIGASARRKAFLGNRPIAISENGEVILLYPDGAKKRVTPKILSDLAHWQLLNSGQI